MASNADEGRPPAQPGPARCQTDTTRSTAEPLTFFDRQLMDYTSENTLCSVFALGLQ